MGNELIAVSDGNETHGSAVWWSLAGKMSLSAIANALATEGANVSAPDEPTALVALREACANVARIHGCKALNVRRGEWAIVRDADLNAGATEVTYPVESTACVIPGGVDAAGPFATEIYAAFSVAKGEISASALGDWLCAQLDRLGATALRDRGGVYFVPSDSVPRWMQIKRAMRALGQNIQGMPVMRSEEAVESILSAITAETESAIGEIDAALAATGDDAPGKRALATKERHTAEMLTKIDRYANLLGVNLESLKDQTRRARGALASAIMAADVEDETKAA